MGFRLIDRKQTNDAYNKWSCLRVCIVVKCEQPNIRSPITNVNIYVYSGIHSEEQLKQFLAESLIMKDFHHPHVLGLLGVCFDAPDGSPYIVLPFMANGSLKKYLKEKRVHVVNITSYPKVKMNVTAVALPLYLHPQLLLTAIRSYHWKC